MLREGLHTKRGKERRGLRQAMMHLFQKSKKATGPRETGRRASQGARKTGCIGGKRGVASSDLTLKGSVDLQCCESDVESRGEARGWVGSHENNPGKKWW